MARDDEFAAFVAARYRALVRTGLLLTGDTGHAGDLAQSALVRTYLAWGRLREPANAEAYARRTLVRLALRTRQRRWTAKIASGRMPDGGPGPLADAGYNEVVVDVRRALATLPAAQRAHTLPAPAGYPPLAATRIWTGRELLALAASGNLLAFHS